MLQVASAVKAVHGICISLQYFSCFPGISFLADILAGCCWSSSLLLSILPCCQASCHPKKISVVHMLEQVHWALAAELSSSN